MVDTLAMAPAPDVQATFCATLIDQWIRLGVTHGVVAPGSRSTPMAIAIAARTEINLHVVHDERVAGFVALGLGSGDGAAPALLLCTSGTAAANFLPAVVEAGLSEVPMIVLTADRPEELRGVGAPQTIDQLELYGRHVTWFRDPGVPEASTSGDWRPLAMSAWSHSVRGPVQLNLAFREPLLGNACELPEPVEPATASARHPGSQTVKLPDAAASPRGLILVGGRHGVDRAQIIELHERTAWPIVADPLSGLRDVSTVTTIDAMLRDESFAAAHRPDVVVRVGRPSTSKPLAQLTASPDVTLVQVGGPGRIDPAHNVAAICSLDDLLSVERSAPDEGWLADWQCAERLATQAIEEWCATAPGLPEPTVARVLAEHAPAGSGLTVSSSMPVRDLEWFGGVAARAHSNRGANGIDGVMSTALGRALARGNSMPEFVLIGDLAYVHDSNALLALAARGVDLRVVVVDNDGGGIFSFLPQADALDSVRFEQLFGTPLGTDVLALASAHGLATSTVSSADELIAQLDEPGPWVCRVASDRERNVADHAAIHVAVASALAAQR